jgi:hypothetical protein
MTRPWNVSTAHFSAATIQWFLFSVCAPLLQLWLALGAAVIFKSLDTDTVWSGAWETGALLFYATGLVTEVLSLQVGKVRLALHLVWIEMGEPKPRRLTSSLKIAIQQTPIELILAGAAAAPVAMCCAIGYIAILKKDADPAVLLGGSIALCLAALVTSFVRHYKEEVDYRRMVQARGELAAPALQDNARYAEEDL